MVQLADRVKVSTSSTGTGNVVLGSAESGYQAVPSSLDGETIRIVIEEGSAWEISTATYTHSSTTLSSRTLTSSSTGSLLNLSGSAKVFISPAAEDIYPINTVLVTVSAGKFVIDGTSQQALSLMQSITYRFDQSNSTNSSHPLKFSTTSNGTHNSGSEYTTGVTVVGTAGSAGSYVEIKLEQDAPSTLYYYCGNHSGMGGSITVGAASSGIALTDLSVTQNAASGTGTLSYNNSSGVFSYTPPASTSSSGGTLDPIKETEIIASNNQTSFPVTYAAGNIAVFLNGSKLGAADFTATNGTSVVLATGATANDLVEVVEYGAPFAAPYKSSIYTANGFTPFNSGNTILTAAYTQGKEGVYVNGVKFLSGTDYTTNTGGTTITFTSALSTNDKVELVEHGALADAASAFTDLTDTPSSLGTAGQVVQVNGAGNALEFADASSGVDNQGTLTKTFTQNEEATITLSNAVSPVPMVSVFKEIPQVGVSSKGAWDVDSTASNYDRLDEAPTSYSGKAITPSNASADGTFSLSSGSIASGDVGKTVEGNGGKAVITATNGSYHLVSAFTNTSAIAAGSWGLFGAVANSDGSGLSLSTTPASGYDLANFSISGTNRKAINATNFGVTFGSNQGCNIAGDGTFVYISAKVSGAFYIYQTALTSAFDLTSHGNKYTFTTGFQYGNGVFTFNSDGSAFYMTARTGGGSTRTLKKWTLTSNYDLSTASADGSVSLNSSGKHGLALAADETFVITSGTSDQNLIKYTFNGAGDISSVTASSVITPSSTYTNFPSSNFSMGDIKLMDGGTKLLFKNYNYQGDYYLVNLTNANDITAGTYVSTTGDIGTVRAYSYGFGIKSDGTKSYHILASSGSAAELVEISLGSAPSFPASTYFPSVTDASGQINSASWTDINSMTADEAAGTGTVNYAVSTDDRTTWSVNKGTDGVRKIAKNNSGTWQYNNNPNLVTTGYDLDGNLAASFSSFTSLSGNSITAFNGAGFSADGTKLYVFSHGDRTFYQFTLSPAWDETNASYASKSFTPASGNNWQVHSIRFNSTGTKMYVGGEGQARNTLYEYSLTTAWDISTANATATGNLPTRGVSGVTGECENIQISPNGSYVYALDYQTGTLHRWSLNTAWDLSSRTSNSPDQTTTAPYSWSAYCWGFDFSADGSKIYITNGNPVGIGEWDLSTSWSISGLSTSPDTSSSWDSGAYKNLIIGNSGLKLFGVDQSSGIGHKDMGNSVSTYGAAETWVNASTNNELSALQQALGAQAINRMGKAQLDAIPDANHFPLGNTLDLMIAVQMASGSTVPKSDGVSMNYDAAALNRQAVNGTDYEAEFPSSTSVKIKSLAAQNLKVRVI